MDSPFPVGAGWAASVWLVDEKREKAGEDWRRAGLSSAAVSCRGKKERPGQKGRGWSSSEGMGGWVPAWDWQGQACSRGEGASVSSASSCSVTSVDSVQEKEQEENEREKDTKGGAKRKPASFPKVTSTTGTNRTSVSASDLSGLGPVSRIAASGDWSPEIPFRRSPGRSGDRIV